MWPEHTNTGDPWDEKPAPWPPFDLGSAVLRESLLDPNIDQEEAVRRAWLAYGASITTTNNLRRAA